MEPLVLLQKYWKLLLRSAAKSLQIWWTLSYLRERFLQIGETTSFLVYLKDEERLQIETTIRGVKLADHVLKINERVVKNIILETVNIDEMLFGFCPGRGTTDAIFILRQVQDKYFAKHRKLISHLSIWKKPSIECLARYCGGFFVLLVYRNG